ncbi:MAG: hypothetical protein GF381_04730 [Candidatus Pacebacteria bacterium]|nr:hypothetical protein [Candidatus Paceibacterota bacterium]
MPNPAPSPPTNKEPLTNQIANQSWSQNKLEQNKPKQLTSFYKQTWFVVLMSIALISIIISAIFGVISSRIATKTTEQENTWRELTPHQSKLKDVYQKLGEPIAVEKNELGNKLLYESDYPVLPHEIVVNDQQNLVFIKEYVSIEVDENISQYQQQWGQADLTEYTRENSPRKALVYLDEGVVLISHGVDGSIEQKWYFPPATEEKFLEMWGNELSETGGAEPEVLLP